MELTKNDIKNILVFLNRTQLSGNEVPVFVGICGKLQNALKEPEKVECTDDFNNTAE